MKLSEIPAGAVFLDVDSIPVVKVGAHEYVAFNVGEPDASRPYPNDRKAWNEGSPMTRAEFTEWLSTGRNRFDAAR